MSQTPKEPWRKRRTYRLGDTGPRMSTMVVGRAINQGATSTPDRACQCGYHRCSKTGPCAPVTFEPPGSEWPPGQLHTEWECSECGEVYHTMVNRVDRCPSCYSRRATGFNVMLHALDLHTVPDREAECVFVPGDRVRFGGKDGTVTYARLNRVEFETADVGPMCCHSRVLDFAPDHKERKL